MWKQKLGSGGVDLTLCKTSTVSGCCSLIG
jgi:hypothetical protein